MNIKEPICKYEGCELVAKKAAKKNDGTHYYSSFCSYHNQIVYMKKYQNWKYRPKCTECGRPVKIKKRNSKGYIVYSTICGRCNHIKWPRKSQGKPRVKAIKSGECIFCGFNIPTALHKHHIARGKLVFLCANCHYILHGLFKSQKLDEMTIEEVLGHLAIVYKQPPKIMKKRQFEILPNTEITHPTNYKEVPYVIEHNGKSII